MRELTPVYNLIRDNLKSRSAHVARIIGGAACEQWFSSEAFAAINWPEAPVLPADCCGIAELRKRDMAIRNETAGRVVATVESKVVYNNKNLWTVLRQLRDQVQRESYDDECDECSHGGLVY